MGYEKFNDITVTRIVKRTNKINSQIYSRAVKTNVNRSVKLNIDNLHFFVGQGRITKIINMKPTELINMLE